jgi:small ligand-binding sensory domain FIST
MGTRIGSALSTLPDARAGTEEAVAAARAGLGDGPCDLAIVFAAGAHLAAPEVMLEVVQEGLAPGHVVGCGAGGVLAGGREVERGTAVAVWAAAFDGGSATPFVGLPDLDAASGAVLLVDPMTFSPDSLAGLPDVPVLGGIASARLGDGGAALFVGDEVVDADAVGVRFDGVNLQPCVSQGAIPIGPELTVTACEGNVILQLAGRPAYERIQSVVSGLPRDEQDLLGRAGGVLLGLVVDANKPDYLQGDFLVRPLLGADRRNGAVAVGAMVRLGQVVRLHVRDADSAARDLRRSLAERRAALGPGPAAGALVFACNGRGRAMFGVEGQDAGTVADVLAGAPAAGFFAAGEIGPVGGECHLHGFTATVALFGS